VLGDVTTQLSNLDLLLQLALEAAKEDFALTRLEAVDNRGNRASAIGQREEDQLVVNEVGHRDLLDAVVEEGAGDVGAEPFLSVFGALLVEGHVDELAVIVIARVEDQPMSTHVAEVALGIRSSRRAQSLCRLKWP
jgi:hypothetical protein